MARGTRVIRASFGQPPAGLVPREGQPCLRGGTLFEVVKLGVEDGGLTVGVRPHGARRGSAVTTMRLEAWRLLFEVPEPPG